MSAVETPLKVVIAADTAMSRDVVRFFLQASGDIEVIGQAASAGDASWMAKKYAADAVVIHAGIAFDATQDAVRQVRSAAPAARIVVVTPEGGGVPLPSRPAEPTPTWRKALASPSSRSCSFHSAARPTSRSTSSPRSTVDRRPTPSSLCRSPSRNRAHRRDRGGRPKPERDPAFGRTTDGPGRRRP